MQSDNGSWTEWEEAMPSTPRFLRQKELLNLKGKFFFKVPWIEGLVCLKCYAENVTSLNAFNSRNNQFSVKMCPLHKKKLRLYGGEDTSSGLQSV